MTSRRGYSEPESGDRPCARDQWCAGAVTVRQDDGSYRREPRAGPRAFCDRDRSVILERLRELPEGCSRLEETASALRRAGSTLRMPFGPSVPLHEGMDAVRREMAAVLAGWHARVAAVANLTRPPLPGDDEHRPPPDPAAMVTGAVATLAGRRAGSDGHIDTLLGLQPGWMSRQIPAPSRQRPEIPRDPLARPGRRVPALDYLPDESIAPPRRADPLPADVAEQYAGYEIVRSGPGYLIVLVLLSGPDAGLEILRFHARCERLLGEVASRAEILEGVPCRNPGCEDMALERAEPPSDPSRPAMHSVCASCRDTMTLAEFREWSSWYARWADGAGLACMRCERGDHEQCTYDRCRCPAGDPHPRRRAVPRGTRRAA